MPQTFIMLPNYKHVPNPEHSDWRLTTCRRCGQDCWESDLARLTKELYPDAVAYCTECSLKCSCSKEGGKDYEQ